METRIARSADQQDKLFIQYHDMDPSENPYLWGFNIVVLNTNYRKLIETTMHGYEDDFMKRESSSSRFLTFSCFDDFFCMIENNSIYNSELKKEAQTKTLNIYDYDGNLLLVQNNAKNNYSEKEINDMLDDTQPNA